MFLFLVSSLSFIFLFLPRPSLSSPLLSLLSLFSLSLGDDTKLPTRVDVLLKPNTLSQFMENWRKLCHNDIYHQILLLNHSSGYWGWSGGAKVSCILCHWGVQLILAYSWARPAILVAGKGRRNVFISSVSSLSFMFFFLPCPSLSSLLLSLLALSLGENTK